MRAAREAGKILLTFFGGEYSIRDKGHNHLVTSADHASNDTLREILLGARSDDGWLSEETADSAGRLSKPRVWVVDPLDGTLEFIDHRPTFTVSVALVVDHLPAAAALFNPATEEMFTCGSGQPAMLNGVPIRCGAVSELKEASIIKSRSETRQGMWTAYEPAFASLATVGSVSYKIALVAAGRADLFVTLTPKNEWDICAAHCVLVGAGGTLLSLDGKEVSYNRERTRFGAGLVAGNRSLVENALQLFGRRATANA